MQEQRAHPQPETFALQWREGDVALVGAVLEASSGVYLVIHRLIQVELGSSAYYQQTTECIGPLPGGVAEARALLVRSSGAARATPDLPPQPTPAPEAVAAQQTYPELGQQFSDVRYQTGLSVNECCKIAGVSHGTYYRWTQGYIHAYYVVLLQQVVKALTLLTERFASAKDCREWLFMLPAGSAESPFDLLRRQKWQAFAALVEPLPAAQPQTETNQHHAQRLKRFSGLTSREAADLLKINSGSYYAYLRGDRDVERGKISERLAMLADLFERADSAFSTEDALHAWLIKTNGHGPSPYELLKQSDYPAFLARLELVAPGTGA